MVHMWRGGGGNWVGGGGVPSLEKGTDCGWRREMCNFYPYKNGGGAEHFLFKLKVEGGG